MNGLIFGPLKSTHSSSLFTSSWQISISSNSDYKVSYVNAENGLIIRIFWTGIFMVRVQTPVHMCSTRVYFPDFYPADVTTWHIFCAHRTGPAVEESYAQTRPAMVSCEPG